MHHLRDLWYKKIYAMSNRSRAERSPNGGSENLEAPAVGHARHEPGGEQPTPLWRFAWVLSRLTFAQTRTEIANHLAVLEGEDDNANIV